MDAKETNLLSRIAFPVVLVVGVGLLVAALAALSRDGGGDPERPLRAGRDLPRGVPTHSRGPGGPGAMNGRRDPKLILFAVLAVGVLIAGVGALAYRSFTAPPVVQVSIVDYRFPPAHVTIKAGTTVRWINMEFVAHTVRFG